MNEQESLRLVDEMLSSGARPLDILEECRRGMFEVGARFERGDMYLSEMIMAAEISKQVTERVRPHLGSSTGANRGKVLIGTVEGDVHDIGKNILVALLEAGGFRVVDLGVDVPPERFVEAIREGRPDVVGMSSLLSTSLEAMKRTVDAIVEAGLRDRVKIVIGGGRLDRYAAEYVKADAYTDNAAQGVKIVEGMVGGR